LIDSPVNGFSDFGVSGFGGCGERLSVVAMGESVVAVSVFVTVEFAHR
jgi:hypothetical protein